MVSYFEGKTLFEDSSGKELEVRDMKYLNTLETKQVRTLDVISANQRHSWR
jgi:hypothetical protein